MSTTPANSTVIWKPVQPESTHCLDILHLEFDVKSGRGAERLSKTDIDEAISGAFQLWQFISIEIAAWPTPSSTQILFQNVVFFTFLEFDFDNSNPMEYLFTNVAQTYDVSALDSSTGFLIPDGVTLDDHGTFCLWRCDESPLAEILIRRLGVYDQDRFGATLSHFKLPCDELGEINIVCAGVQVIPGFTTGQ